MNEELVQQQLPIAVSAAAAKSGTEGWAYVGHYIRSANEWKTKYFDLEDTTSPEMLENKTLQVREATGALNVRSGMPTPAGSFPQVIGVLTPGSKVTVRCTKMIKWQQGDTFRLWTAFGRSRLLKLVLCSICAQHHLTPAHSSLLQPKLRFRANLGWNRPE